MIFKKENMNEFKTTVYEVKKMEQILPDHKKGVAKIFSKVGFDIYG